MDASPDQIKVRFRQLAKELHPDSAGREKHAQHKNVEEFIKVNEAYEIIISEIKAPSYTTYTPHKTTYS
jgi:DnaJ-class molecular chaperone